MRSDGISERIRIPCSVITDIGNVALAAIHIQVKAVSLIFSMSNRCRLKLVDNLTHWDSTVGINRLHSVCSCGCRLMEELALMRIIQIRSLRGTALHVKLFITIFRTNHIVSRRLLCSTSLNCLPFLLIGKLNLQFFINFFDPTDLLCELLKIYGQRFRFVHQVVVFISQGYYQVLLRLLCSLINIKYFLIVANHPLKFRLEQLVLSFNL